MTPSSQPGGFWQRWRAERALRRNAMSYVRSLQAEPDDADARFVSDHVTAGDLDHARWELRYARRALGLLTAERDALDDRTASAVARALAESAESDRQIAPEKREVAQKQLNARLYAYRLALMNREAHAPTAARLASTLLTYGGGGETRDAETLERLGSILASYMLDANQRLRDIFGTAQLPEDIAPSQVAAGGN